MDNPLIELFDKLEIIDKKKLKHFHHRTRDNEKLNVLKCPESGVVLLAESLDFESKHYLKNTDNWRDGSNDFEIKINNKIMKTTDLNDNTRRLSLLKPQIKNKRILDFGCGDGVFLELAKQVAEETVGVETNEISLQRVLKKDIECFSSLSELGKNKKFDIITMHHVLEHLSNPIEILLQLKQFLKAEGKLIIEVPHARDILLSSFNIEEFKNFTLWSEHLVLFTRYALTKLLNNVGLIEEEIKGIQRFPISNHFHWLHSKLPGGHEIHKNLDSEEFHIQYEKHLNKIDQTDTIVGYYKYL